MVGRGLIGARYRHAHRLARRRIDEVHRPPEDSYEPSESTLRAQDEADNWLQGLR